MSAEGYVLDTSALFSLVEDEPGADRVEEVLRNEQVWIPWLVLLELAYVTRQEKGEAEYRYSLSKSLPATVLWEADEPTLLTAARYKASHRVSLTDAIIAAFAGRRGVVPLHKDPEYEALNGEVDLEALPYQSGGG